MSKLNVLIVDDELFFRTLVYDWVTSWGYDATLAASGLEAVDFVKNIKYDVVILDYMMPEMDGLEALKEIRYIDSEVAAIMFTAHPTGESISGAEKLGISAYVTKLNDAVNIQHALRSVISLIEKKYT